jgi:hypothetical protein
MRQVTTLELAMVCVILVLGPMLTLSMTGCETSDIKDKVAELQGTTTTTIPPAVADGRDAIDFNAITWLGLNYGGAVIDAKLSGATMTTRHLTLNEPAPSNWVLVGQPPNQVQGRVFLFYKKGADWVGGYFEQLRPGQTVKMMHNVHQGKNGLHYPPAGVDCWTMTGSMDRKFRSNISKVTR